VILVNNTIYLLTLISTCVVRRYWVLMTTVTSVVQQFVVGLKSRNEETRSAMARELKQYVSTELKEVLPDDVTTFMDEFNHQILEMVSSQDTSEKKGGILAIGIILCL